jgi:gliding motility-associated protein GldL
MNFANKKPFKVMMSRLYGWGASVVILGALFKIMHWPFADIALIVGMGTEVIVFFFSAFEKVHEEPDWSLVYPELAGIEDMAGPGRDPRAIGSANISLSANLDKLLEEANIGPELINNLGRGLRNLSDNASRLADMSNAAAATNQYIQHMEQASKSVLELSQSYKNTTEYLKHDLSLSNEYSNSLKSVVHSMNDMSESYKKTAASAQDNLYASEDLAKSVKSMTSHSNEMGAAYSKNAAILTEAVDAMQNASLQGKTYNEQLQKTNQNLSALNTAYEIQLQAANMQADSTERLNKTLGSLEENVNQTVLNSQKYQTELDQLTNNIRALNSVYGNMLSAMNFNVNR